MNTLALAAALLSVTLLLAPAATATGWLVNVETGVVDLKHGTNAFGGSGDTVDVGFQNYQCSDEDDVVDIGIQNREGDGACGYYDPYTGETTCASDQGRDDVVIVGSTTLGFQQVILLPRQGGIDFAVLPISTSGERPAHCSDDGDTVDVGVDNDEGGYGDDATGEACWWRTQQDRAAKQEPGYQGDPTGRDRADAVDVGVLNRECGDDRDAGDVGIANCEYDDVSDGIDVGAFNLEYFDDDDTFDVSLFNAEIIDTPDGNGINIGAPSPIPCGLGLDDPCGGVTPAFCGVPRCHVDPTTGQLFCELF